MKKRASKIGSRIISKKIGHIIKEFRQGNKYTQEEVATYLGLSRSYYTTIELGNTQNIPVQLILKLSTLYGITILEFVEFHPSSKNRPKDHRESRDSEETEAMVINILQENQALKQEIRKLKTLILDSHQPSMNKNGK